MPILNNIEIQPSTLAPIYFSIKRDLIENGFAGEIDWQDELNLEQVSESDFLREASWVILSSGMAYYVVNGLFSKIAEAFHYWKSAELIIKESKDCRKKALKHFAHNQKIDAILFLASYVAENGFEYVRSEVRLKGLNFLQQFPYLGPATSSHLAKNIGLRFAKPDRHLDRISKLFGYSCPNDMCDGIAQNFDENIAVVDLVFWRFASLHKNYLEILTSELNQHHLRQEGIFNI